MSRKIVTAVAFLSLFFLPAFHAGAEETAPIRLQEQKIKAGLLYNFIKHSRWPQAVFKDSGTPFQVCLLGGDAFSGALNPLQGRTAQQRSINVRKIYAPRRAENCHVVFIHRNQEKRLQTIFDELKGSHALTASDIDGFSSRGGMVEFSNPTGSRIHLRINENALRSEGLSISEQLVKLAEVRR